MSTLAGIRRKLNDSRIGQRINHSSLGFLVEGLSLVMADKVHDLGQSRAYELALTRHPLSARYLPEEIALPRTYDERHQQACLVRRKREEARQLQQRLSENAYSHTSPFFEHINAETWSYMQRKSFREAWENR